MRRESAAGDAAQNTLEVRNASRKYDRWLPLAHCENESLIIETEFSQREACGRVWGRSEGWGVSGFLMLPFTDKSRYYLERQRDASCFHAVLIFFILFCCRPSTPHLGGDSGWMDTSCEDEINRKEWAEREEEDKYGGWQWACTENVKGRR